MWQCYIAKKSMEKFIDIVKNKEIDFLKRSIRSGYCTTSRAFWGVKSPDNLTQKSDLNIFSYFRKEMVMRSSGVSYFTLKQHIVFHAGTFKLCTLSPRDFIWSWKNWCKQSIVGIQYWEVDYFIIFTIHFFYLYLFNSYTYTYSRC